MGSTPLTGPIHLFGEGDISRFISKNMAPANWTTGNGRLARTSSPNYKHVRVVFFHYSLWLVWS